MLDLCSHSLGLAKKGVQNQMSGKIQKGHLLAGAVLVLQPPYLNSLYRESLHEDPEPVEKRSFVVRCKVVMNYH
jgi:hypothetical protein